MKNMIPESLNEMAEEYVSDKEQDETPEEQLTEVETWNLLGKQNRVMIVKMIRDIEKRMGAQIEKIQEMSNKDLEDLRNEQTKNSRAEMKNI